MDTASNASSTDEYIRELLDPDDRPKNVWRLVEGPQGNKRSPDQEGQNQDQVPAQDNEDVPHAQEDKLSYLRKLDDEDEDSRPKEPHRSHPEYEESYSQEQRRSKLNEDYNASEEIDDARSRSNGDDNLDEEKDSHGNRHRNRERRSSSSRHRRQRYPLSPSDRRGSPRHRCRSRSVSTTRSRRRSVSRSPSRSRADYHSSSRSRSRRSARRKSRRHRSRSRSRSRSPRRSRHHREISTSQSPLTKRNSRTIFLMQLSPRTTSRDLDNFFSPIGRVREVRLIIDSKTRKHKGIAYIEFESASSAEKAMILNGKKLHGIPISIQPSQADKNHHSYFGSSDHSALLSHSYPNSRSTLPPNSLRVYVGGLHPNITEDMLRSLFEPFGDLLRIELMKDHMTGQSRGYAFITFANIDEAQEAIQGLNGLELGGKPLKVSKSTERSERRN